MVYTYDDEGLRVKDMRDVRVIQGEIRHEHGIIIAAAEAAMATSRAALALGRRWPEIQQRVQNKNEKRRLRS